MVKEEELFGKTEGILCLDLGVYLACLIRCHRTAEFVTSPSPLTLVQALKEFAEAEEIPNAQGLPWPVSLCLQACETKNDIRELAEHVRSGSLGSAADWLAAEERWRAGASLQEMYAPKKGSPPFDSNIGRRGLPTNAISVLQLSPIQAKSDEILLQVRSIPDQKGRSEAACWILRSFRFFPSNFPSKGLEELMMLAIDGTWGIDVFHIFGTGR